MEEPRTQPRFDDLWELGAQGDRDALLETIERIVGLGTWVWDVRHHRVAWSQGLYRILGYERGRTEATLENFFAAVHPDDVARVRKESERNSLSGKTPTIHCRVRHADGQLRHIRMDAVAVLGEDGHPLRLVGTVLDTTESRARERELTRTAELLTEAQRTARVGSWYFDTETDHVEWSEELYRILGLSPDLPPSHDLFYSRVHPEDLPRLLYTRERSLQGHIEPIELRILAGAGKERTVLMEARLLPHEYGAKTFLGTVLDITERKRLEQELRQAQKIEAIGRLAGGIAHDFNNLLAVIRGSAELLASSTEAQELDDILEAADRGAALTRQLLAFGRRAVVHCTVLDLNEQVLGAARMLRRLIGEDIRIKLELEGELWNIKADASQLEQVLMNLAVNARDAMPQGGVLTLKTGNLPGHGRADQVMLMVTDTGLGMSAETRAHIFEPFFTTKPVGHGTGLGLPTVLGIVAQSGGTVAVESELGCGTTFTLCFPRAHEQPPSEEASPPPRVLTGHERVLLVEDDESVRSVMHRILKDAGYTVTQAPDAARALEIARSRAQPFDIVISDVVMPGMSGPVLAEQLERERLVRHVLFVSGYAPPSEPALPGAVYLQKPFGRGEFLSMVRATLETAGR